MPGTVQADNYDTGGQGVAYNVTSVNGIANSYRSDGVDLEACTDSGSPGCGNDLGWTGTGQWFKYTVNVATAGTYTVSLRLASPNGVTDGLHIASSSGANLSGNINVPATGGWQTWTTVTATVTLPAGQQTLTLDQDNGGLNIRYLSFAAPPPRKAPSAERLRLCLALCRQLTTTLAGRAWRTTSPRSTATPTATAPTASTWKPPPTPAAATTWAGRRGGQWFKYTVNVATARSYTVTLRLASPNGVTDGLHIASSSGRQPVREHQRPGHRRLADLDHRHGNRHAARRAADPDH